MQTDVAIVGGGLAGLALADRLARRGRDFLLFEARGRLGGRIDTLRDDGAAFDLGPSWFWPGQPRIADLIARLGLEMFDQASLGDGVFEDAGGRIQRARGFAGMAGSCRIVGGMARLIAVLAEGLPPGRVRCDAAVRGIAPDGVTLAGGERIGARRVVLALPPRLAARFAYAPALPARTLAAMAAIPTWMGGQAKFVATYDRPFWRDAGLSGDGASQRGPLAEIHDASAHGDRPAALFGFVGIPPAQRTGGLTDAALTQLARMFGPAALSPRHTALRDWAGEPFTASAADQAPMTQHPAYGLPAELENLWNGALLLAGSETAPEFGGYLEGALAAAEQTAATLDRIQT